MKGRHIKLTKVTLATVLLACSAAVSGHAWGHGGSQLRFGVVVGDPLWYGPAYYPPYYYPPVYYPAIPVAPPVYIERGEAQSAPAAQQHAYWYYCAEAKGYYPYVKECPGGWQRVSPQPPPSPSPPPVR